MSGRYALLASFILTVLFGGLSIGVESPIARALAGAVALVALAIAGYEGWSSERGARRAIEQALEEDKDNQAAADRLWSLRSQGVEIRNRRITPEEFAAWREEYNSWRDQVLLAAQRFDKNLRPRLETLDTVRSAPADLQPINPKHQKLIETMTEILARLYESLSR